MAIVISGPSNDILVNGSSVVTEAEAASPVLDASYHIYNGQVSLSNSVTTTGFNTILYTGNGTSQSITTDVDLDTQWGNDASEKFGGLVWTKSRSVAGNNIIVTTVQGIAKNLAIDSTNAEATNSTYVTNISSTGFTLGSAAQNNNAVTYASWNFQTTHRVSGTTNHGKAFTCHYNPFTGFTMVKYEGSGLAGHEIPHYLGRKLDFVAVKNLSVVADWIVNTSVSMGLTLNSTIAHSSGNNIYDATTNQWSDNSNVKIGFSVASLNASSNQYIMLGWANSYFDEKNTLIGNYEIGVYQGTGVAGNKVATRGKPAWIMVKNISQANNWYMFDNQRNSGDSWLIINSNGAESSITDTLDINNDGFTFKLGGASTHYCNGTGDQYLYMVVYDNDSGSGKSKYPRATDTSTLNLNAHVPFANGIDTTGSKVSIAYKNETITLSNALVQGKNYVALLNNGTYVASPSSPNYGSYNGFGDYFDLNSQKWFSNVSTFSDDFLTDKGWTVSNGTKALVNGKLVCTATSTSACNAFKWILTEIGKTYKFRASLSYTNVQLYIGAGGSTYSQFYNASTDASITFVATTTSTQISLSLVGGTSGVIGSFDNVSVYPINADGSVDISNATVITPRNYLDCIVYADQNGQPEYVEQIEKVQYFDAVKANDFRGKNACTAWVNFNGTTTPPTIRDSYNIASVVRVSTGSYDVYFKEDMDNTNYSLSISGDASSSNYANAFRVENVYSTIKKVRVDCFTALATNTLQDNLLMNLTIFGGKN